MSIRSRPKTWYEKLEENLATFQRAAGKNYPVTCSPGRTTDIAVFLEFLHNHVEPTRNGEIQFKA